MKQKMFNRIQLSGKVYSHKLSLKTVQKEGANFGTEFINGTIDVATDDAGLNIVTVSYTYVTAKTKSGGANGTFTALKKIMDENKTILEVGADNAVKVKIDSAIGVNDFYSDNAKDPEKNPDGLISSQRADGGFVTIISALPKEDERNKFECDFIITNATTIPANPEKNIENDYMKLKGFTFNFKNDVLPITLLVKTPGGINYFDSLGINEKNIVFTKVWGAINSQTVVRRVEEESAWGTAQVKEYSSSIREWVISGCAREVYEFGSEDAITVQEFTEKLANRQTYLAEVKARQDAYTASKSNNFTAAPTNNAAPAYASFL